MYRYYAVYMCLFTKLVHTVNIDMSTCKYDDFTANIHGTHLCLVPIERGMNASSYYQQILTFRSRIFVYFQCQIRISAIMADLSSYTDPTSP
jgi:hypothetical protein